MNTTAAETQQPVSPLTRNALTIEVLSGEKIQPEDYALVANRFHRAAGPKLLGTDSYEMANQILKNEKVPEDLKKSTQEVLAAHQTNMAKLLETLAPSLITILNHPIGAEKTEELTAAYKELGGLGERLLSRRFLPGLSMQKEKHSTMLNGLTPDAYAVAKAIPKLADLVEAAETRKTVAAARITELRANFEEKFTAAQVRLFRTLETMQAILTDPALVPYEHKKALLVTVGKGKNMKQVPIFEKGKLTEAAKEKLNEMQAQEGQPEFLVKMIRGIFAKNTQNIQINKAQEDIGL